MILDRIHNFALRVIMWRVKCEGDLAMSICRGFKDRGEN